MVFSSMLFLWIFLPVVLVLGLIFRKPSVQNILLLIASLIFYAWGEPRHLLLLLVSIFINWLSGILIDRYRNRKTLILILCIAANLGLLGYFKYCNFVLNTLDHLLPMVKLPRYSIALPIGISFFTFQAMSYVIDLYRGEYEVQKDPLKLALYVSFFPQLIAGPIVKYREINRELTDRKITADGLSEGMRRFVYGLGKKVIIANTVAQAVDQIFNIQTEQMTGLLAWAGALLYTMQIYYDFSGYSDMAIGLGRMFGFHFLENFNYPYISRSITEFWRRWHISLSSWFREYLYIPLGGNRKGKVRTYINLFIVFAVTGLWHGASWNFVGWGLYHGFFMIIERLGFRKLLDKLKVINWVYCFLVAVIGWIFFRVESISYGLSMVIRMFMPWKYNVSDINFRLIVTSHTVFAFICGVIGMGLIQSLFLKIRGGAAARRYKGSIVEFIFLTLVLIYSIMQLANNAYNPFIYFRF